MKTAKKIISSNASSILAIIIFAFFAHSLFIFNQGVYWDSWIYYFHLITNNFSAFQLPFSENGRPLQGLIFWFIGHDLGAIFHFGLILAFRLVTVSCIAVSGVLFFLILRKFLKLDRLTIIAITFLGMVNSSYQTNLSFVTIIYVIFLPFYLGSLYLSLLQLDICHNVFLKVIVRILSLILLLFSFIAEATIPLVLITLIAIFCYKYKDYNFKKLTITSIIKFILKYSDYIVITIMYLILMYKFMHPYGSYSEVRHIRFNLPHLMLLCVLYIGVAFNFVNLNPFHTTVPVVHVFHGALWYNSWLILNYAIILFFSILLGVLFALKQKKGEYILRDRINRKLVCLLFFGTVSILLIGLPFVAGNKLPYFTGWNLRFSVLTAFPVAIVLIVFLRFLLRLLKQDQVKKIFIIYFCIVSLSVISLWRDYLGWQGRWALDRSAIIHFSQNILIKKAPIIFIARMYDRAFNEGYRYYALSFMLNSIWLSEYTKIVIPHSPALCSKYVNLLVVKPHLVVYGGKIKKDSNIKDAVVVKLYSNDDVRADDYWKLGFKYIYKRLFLSEVNFISWLKGLVVLQVKPYNNWRHFTCK
jgi:hypothetical protein